MSEETEPFDEMQRRVIDTLRARIAELESQLAAAVKLGPHDTKEAFDWALLGKLDEMERDAARWKECERLVYQAHPVFCGLWRITVEGDTFAAAIDASIAERGDG